MCIYSIRKDTNKLTIDWFNDSENQPPEDVWIERIAIHLEGVHTRYFHDQKAMWHKSPKQHKDMFVLCLLGMMSVSSAVSV